MSLCGGNHTRYFVRACDVCQLIAALYINALSKTMCEEHCLIPLSSRDAETFVTGNMVLAGMGYHFSRLLRSQTLLAPPQCEHPADLLSVPSSLVPHL